MDSSTWLDLDLTIGSLRFPVDSPADALEAELRRATEENKKLNEMLAEAIAGYSSLRGQLMDMIKIRRRTAASSEGDGSRSRTLPPAGKRKGGGTGTGTASVVAEEEEEEDECKPRVRKLHVRADTSDSRLVVRDGYQWRKYGQKVTRNNPNPRAYLGCSFAPPCRAKRRVQRSTEDQSIDLSGNLRRRA